MNEFIVTVGGGKKTVKILDENYLLLDGEKIKYELHHSYANNYLLKLENKFFEANVQSMNGGSYLVSMNGSVYETIVRTTLQEKASRIIEQTQALSSKVEIKAPMPGMVLRIKVKPGDTVQQGDSLLILEAMKMENEIKSPRSGIVQELMVKENTAVDKNTKLLIIE